VTVPSLGRGKGAVPRGPSLTVRGRRAWREQETNGGDSSPARAIMGSITQVAMASAIFRCIFRIGRAAVAALLSAGAWPCCDSLVKSATAPL
jgi:hypothetical protein